MSLVLHAGGYLSLQGCATAFLRIFARRHRQQDKHNNSDAQSSTRHAACYTLHCHICEPDAVCKQIQTDTHSLQRCLQSALPEIQNTERMSCVLAMHSKESPEVIMRAATGSALPTTCVTHRSTCSTSEQRVQPHSPVQAGRHEPLRAHCQAGDDRRRAPALQRLPKQALDCLRAHRANSASQPRASVCIATLPPPARSHPGQWRAICTTFLCLLVVVQCTMVRWVYGAFRWATTSLA